MGTKNARVILNEEDFKNLVTGKEVNKDGADIILSDIGFLRMLHIVRDAMVEEKEDVRFEDDKTRWM